MCGIERRSISTFNIVQPAYKAIIKRSIEPLTIVFKLNKSRFPMNNSLNPTGLQLKKIIPTFGAYI